jgi:hypothetical protein
MRTSWNYNKKSMRASISAGLFVLFLPRTLAGVLEASCYVLEALSRIPLCSTYLEALLFDFILKYIILHIQVPPRPLTPIYRSSRHPPSAHVTHCAFPLAIHGLSCRSSCTIMSLLPTSVASHVESVLGRDACLTLASRVGYLGVVAAVRKSSWSGIERSL